MVVIHIEANETLSSDLTCEFDWEILSWIKSMPIESKSVNSNYIK